jgi:hypothetical protein
MLNVGLGAECLYAYVAAFHAVPNRPKGHVVTLWHLVTVLPLVFNEASRRAITKRRVASGLRSILTRNPDNDIAQNEAIFNLNGRMRSMYPRTLRSLNCAIAWRMLTTSEGAFVSLSKRRKSVSGEALEIIRAAERLGTWAGQSSTFEYFTILGVEFHR